MFFSKQKETSFSFKKIRLLISLALIVAASFLSRSSKRDEKIERIAGLASEKK